MRAVVVGVVALALVCTVAAADGIKQIAAPEHLVAKPLEVGQWATYRESVGGHEVGAVALRAINRAECGMQFLAVLAGDGTEQRWIFCVDDDHHIVKATLDGKLVVVDEHLAELGALRTRVLPPAFTGTFTREDVLVPAGRFEGSQRKDGTTATWLHPDVPLGGVVRVTQGDREDVLVAYGAGKPAVVAAVATPRPRSPHRRLFRALSFYEFGLSSGYRSHTPMSDHLEGLTLSIGLPGSEKLEPVLWMSGADNRSEVGSDAQRTMTFTALVGARWHPFGRHVDGPPVGLPYVEAGIGYARVGANDQPTGDGVAAGARIGWELMQGAGWGLALQGEYVVDHTFGDVAGTHQLVDGQVAVRLQLP